MRGLNTGVIITDIKAVGGGTAQEAALKPLDIILKVNNIGLMPKNGVWNRLII